MSKPYINCFMMTTIDGKISGEFLESDFVKDGIDLYFKLENDFRKKGYKGFMVGRHTIEELVTHDKKPDLSKYKGKKSSREDFISSINEGYYAITFDPRGILAWKSNKIPSDVQGYANCTVIEILTEKVSDEYLLFLKDLNISYLICGKEQVDINLCLEKLHNGFKMDKIMLEGGGFLNSSFIKLNAIDEINLVSSPVSAGSDSVSVFGNGSLNKYKINEFKKEGKYLLIQYLKEN